jgi:hypothetical protein
MTAVSNCGGVMGAEERCKRKSGHTFEKLFFKRRILDHHPLFFKGASSLNSQPVNPGQRELSSTMMRCDAHGAAMRTSFSFSVIFMPGWSRKNRISEAGSLEE